MSLSARERRLLGFLGLLAALLALRLLWQASKPAPSAAGPGGSPVAAGRAGGAAGSLPEAIVVLRTDRLDAGEPRDLEVGRDPFRFAELEPPPPPPGPSAEELARRLREEQERLRLEEEQLVELGPQPPEFDLRFLGSFGTRRRPIAVFSDPEGENIYNAREGDTLEDRFVVAKIGYESVDIGFVEFPDVPALRLGIAP